MNRPKTKQSASLTEQMLDEASWLLSHAQALGDYGRYDEAAAEMTRAANCEEQVACLLEADGQELEAAVHRVSAASCCEKLGQYTRAVTLLRAALAGPLHDTNRARVRKQWTSVLVQARKEVNQAAKRRTRKESSSVS